MKRSEFKEFINELLKDGRIKSIQITGWKECGEFDGDDPRPTLQIETRPIGEWPALSEQELSRKPVETTNEQPKKEYCIAKCKSNKPEGYEDCKCHNFCKFDGIQFDTSLG